MTDKELLAAMWVELEQTTSGYRNLRVRPPTDPKSRWFKARKLRDQIGATQPPSGGYGVAGYSEERYGN